MLAVLSLISVVALGFQRQIRQSIGEYNGSFPVPLATPTPSPILYVCIEQDGILQNTGLSVDQAGNFPLCTFDGSVYHLFEAEGAANPQDEGGGLAVPTSPYSPP